MASTGAWRPGQIAEVMRSDGSWSKCQVSRLNPDRSVTVIITDGSNAEKVIPSNCNMLRLVHQDRVTAAQQALAQQAMAQQAIAQRAMPQQAMPQQAIPQQTMVQLAMAQQAMAQNAMAQQAMAGTENLRLGQMAEVLRSDGSWSLCKVVRLNPVGSVTVHILDGNNAEKVIPRNSNMLRLVQPGRAEAVHQTTEQPTVGRCKGESRPCGYAGLVHQPIAPGRCKTVKTHAALVPLQSKYPQPTSRESTSSSSSNYRQSLRRPRPPAWRQRRRLPLSRCRSM